VNAWRALVALVLLHVSCNVYNPSGEADPQSNADWIEQGNAQLRDLRFTDAQESFGRVLALDSGNTEAWLGYAKAVSGQSLDVSLLLQESLDAQKEGRKPLWDISCQEKDSAYRSILPTWSVLARWKRLDSLGRASMPTTQVSEYGLLSLARSMLAFWDYDADGRIDSAGGDRTAWLLFRSDNVDGGFQPELDRVEFTLGDTTGQLDTAQVADFNAMLDRSKSDVSVLLALAGKDTATDAVYASIRAQSPEAIGMYRVSDLADNDMDGCLDEELLDSLDNDGDGLVDEDARAGYRLTISKTEAGPGVPALRFLPDGTRDDRLSDSLGNGRASPVGQDLLWRYGNREGRMEVFAPLWDTTHPDQPALRWKRSCAPSDGICTGSLAETTNRLAVNEHIRSVAPGQARALEGCRLLGGCWCLHLREFYRGIPPP